MSHFWDVLKGFVVVAVVCLLIAWWASEDQVVFGDKKNSVSTAVTTSSENDDGSTLNQLTHDDLKSFSGTTNGVAKTNDLASVTVPVSEEERAVGNSDPYGEKFDKYIFKRYPDISKVRFHPDETMREDPEVLHMYKTSFYRGLYFAKQIPLANGETLFDLLTKCSKKMTSADGADFDRGKEFSFYIQFFPTFKQNATRTDFDENVLFNRVGDKIIAKSPFFSSAIINNPNFMSDFGLSCAK